MAAINTDIASCKPSPMAALIRPPVAADSPRRPLAITRNRVGRLKWVIMQAAKISTMPATHPPIRMPFIDDGRSLITDPQVGAVGALLCTQHRRSKWLGQGPLFA